VFHEYSLLNPALFSGTWAQKQHRVVTSDDGVARLRPPNTRGRNTIIKEYHIISTLEFTAEEKEDVTLYEEEEEITAASSQPVDFNGSRVRK